MATLYKKMVLCRRYTETKINNNMTQEDKELLLKDLCVRLPYGVMIEITSDGGIMEVSYDMRLDDGLLADLLHSEDDFKPYLRPLSSMTDEEEKDFKQMIGGSNTNWYLLDKNKLVHPKSFYNVILNILTIGKIVDWLNRKKFDYRGLIEKGLALEAPEDMYKTK